MKFVEPPQGEAAHDGTKRAATAKQQAAVDGVDGVSADEREQVVSEESQQPCSASTLSRITRVHRQMPVMPMNIALYLPVNRQKSLFDHGNARWLTLMSKFTPMLKSAITNIQATQQAVK